MLRSFTFFMVLVAAASLSTWAGPILQSDVPIPITGDGEFGWAPSEASGGFVFVGNGSNGVDFIHIELFLSGLRAYFLPGSTISGVDVGANIFLNGLRLPSPSYHLGDSSSHVSFYNAELMATEYVPLSAYFHVTSFKYIEEAPGYPLDWVGKFVVSPVAPVPEPATFGLVALMLGLGYLKNRVWKWSGNEFAGLRGRGSTRSQYEVSELRATAESCRLGIRSREKAVQ